jgi:hypothetical protein
MVQYMLCLAQSEVSMLAEHKLLHHPRHGLMSVRGSAVTLRHLENISHSCKRN